MNSPLWSCWMRIAAGFDASLSLTTGIMAGLIVLAAMAPGASLHGRKHTDSKKHTGGQSAAALVATGHTLFLTNCSPCHGAEAQGDDGPNLHHKNLPDTFIAEAVKTGFKNEMPPFGSKLKPAEVKALVAYVHSLQP